jgi:alpha-L-arabinofuranosidase
MMRASTRREQDDSRRFQNSRITLSDRNVAAHNFTLVHQRSIFWSRDRLPTVYRRITMRGLIVALSFGLAVFVPSISEAGHLASVTVVVDPSSGAPPIDRNIYGQFIEHLGRVIYEGIWVGEGSPIRNIRGFREDVVEALQKIHVPVIRWPGGCFADSYNWRDGIGPRASRPIRRNINWGGLDDNSFGTHEFLDFTELLGADAYVSGNLGSMSPLEMADWMEYMTSADPTTLAAERQRNGRDKPWRIKYFGLGNELWGCGGDMRGDYAADVTARYSTFLEPPPNETVVKVASGPSGDSEGFDYAGYAEAMMKRATGNFEALSLHYYARLPTAPPAVGFSEIDWAAMLDAARRMHGRISTVSAIMDRYDPKKQVSLFVDEWAALHKRVPGHFQQNTLLDAEVAALTFNIFHRHTDRVKMANVTLMVNAGQALILTDKNQMLVTPTYHVYDMYQPFRGASPLAAHVVGPTYFFAGHNLPMVDVSVAKRLDGKLYLALVNLNPHERAKVTTNLSGNAYGTILTGASMDAHNTFDAPNTVHPVPFEASTDAHGQLQVELPAKSITVLALE